MSHLVKESFFSFLPAKPWSSDLFCRGVKKCEETPWMMSEVIRPRSAHLCISERWLKWRDCSSFSSCKNISVARLRLRFFLFFSPSWICPGLYESLTVKHKHAALSPRGWCAPRHAQLWASIPWKYNEECSSLQRLSFSSLPAVRAAQTSCRVITAQLSAVY